MRLVVDTSIIFAAILRDSTTRRILLSAPIEFLTPEYCFEEIREHLNELCERNELPLETNKEMIDILRRNIRIVHQEFLIQAREEAEALMHDIDVDDAPFLAAALSIRCDGIWTEDPHFLKQTSIKVWRTKDLLHFIK